MQQRRTVRRRHEVGPSFGELVQPCEGRRRQRRRSTGLLELRTDPARDVERVPVGMRPVGLGQTSDPVVVIEPELGRRAGVQRGQRLTQPSAEVRPPTAHVDPLENERVGGHVHHGRDAKGVAPAHQIETSCFGREHPVRRRGARLHEDPLAIDPCCVRLVDRSPRHPMLHTNRGAQRSLDPLEAGARDHADRPSPRTFATTRSTVA